MLRWLGDHIHGWPSLFRKEGWLVWQGRGTYRWKLCWCFRWGWSWGCEKLIYLGLFLAFTYLKDFKLFFPRSSLLLLQQWPSGLRLQENSSFCKTWNNQGIGSGKMKQRAASTKYQKILSYSRLDRNAWPSYFPR